MCGDAQQKTLTTTLVYIEKQVKKKKQNIEMNFIQKLIGIQN